MDLVQYNDDPVVDYFVLGSIPNGAGPMVEWGVFFSSSHGETTTASLSLRLLILSYVNVGRSRPLLCELRVLSFSSSRTL